MRKVGLPILILVAASVVTTVLVISKPKPEKVELETPEFLVDAEPFVQQDVDFLVYAQGNVQPKHQTVLSSQVSGRVINISPKFVEGGFFSKGELLVELEKADYETDLLLAEAEMARAKAALDEEVARGRVAQKEWSSVNSGTPPELGLRKPQLAREQANLKAAKANYQRALRNLERTNIRAPYDGLVKSRMVDIGQFLPLGGQIGEIFSTDVAEVRIPLTDSDVNFIGNIKERQPSVQLEATVAGEKRFWTGKMVRDEAVLDENRRVIYGVVEVNDPYNLKSATFEMPLKFGRFVRAIISGISESNIIKLPRYTLRLDGTVLTVDQNNTLKINEVDVVRAEEDFVFIKKGLNTAHKVVMSAVSQPYDGMKVKIVESQPSLMDDDAMGVEEQRL